MSSNLPPGVTESVNKDFLTALISNYVAAEIEPRVRNFWGNVKRNDACWEWQGYLNHKGYGRLTFLGKSQSAHRLAWELTFGSIPEALCVLHRCDNRKCVRPSHLFLGTIEDNTADMVSKGRNSAPRLDFHPRAILSSDDVKQIRAAHARGDVTYQELAETFAISKSQIGSIIREESWSGV